MNCNRLKEQCAIVTGGAGGIGRAIVDGLLAEGANVLIVDVDEGLLGKFARELDAASDRGQGRGRFATLVADVGRPSDCELAVVKSSEEFGGPQILVNNAAMGMQYIRDDHMTRLVTIDEIEPEVWQRFVDVNLSGPFYMTRAASSPMLQNGQGRIIDITTSFFTMLRGRFHPYGPSKAGMEAMAAGHAAEFSASGITVNVVVPGGPADTPMVPQVSGLPREELIPPAAMVPPIVWLCSGSAATTTGRRFIAADWNTDLPEAEAAAACSGPIGWPDLATSPVWPGGRPED